MAQLDHLVFVSPDLAAGVDYVRLFTGIDAADGGSHPDLGTHNALIGLGPGRYLEIIGLDPEQPDPERPVAFGVTDETERHLHTLAVRPDPGQTLESLVHHLSDAGWTVSESVAMHRTTTAGDTLAWRLAFIDAPDLAPVAPFLIDWGDTPHPTDSAPSGCTLDTLWVQHPVPDSARRLYDDLDLDVDVEIEVWPRPALRAAIDGAHGVIDLR